MIDLPEWPAPNGADMFFIDFGAVLTPALGGPVQKVLRMGSRFGASVSMPPMPSDKLGRQWLSRLVQGKIHGARMPLPLLDFDPGAPGTNIQVNASGQTGSSFVIKGVTPNYIFREGQFFSVVTGGKHHLYMVAAETFTNGSGVATLPIAPMLRRPHLINDAVFVAQPMIEGFIGGDELAWNMSLERHLGFQFDIRESQ